MNRLSSDTSLGDAVAIIVAAIFGIVFLGMVAWSGYEAGMIRMCAITCAPLESDRKEEVCTCYERKDVKR